MGTGTAKFTDADGFFCRYASLTLQEAKEIYDMVYPYATKKNGECEKSYDIIQFLFTFNGIQSEENWEAHKNKTVAFIRRYVSYSSEYNLALRVGQWEAGKFAYLYLGNPKHGIIVIEPEKYLEFIPDCDYSDVTPAQMQKALRIAGATDNKTSLIPSEAENLTVRSLQKQASEQADAISDIDEQIQDAEKEKTDELAELRMQMEKIKQELDRKKADLMAQLAAKKAEMEEMKEKLENQIYLLDSQIYAIRCYAGEVINFKQLVAGQKAADSTPVVIYQKLHYLDEDLARLASLYEIQWNELNLFEDFLRHSPLARETFAPNERCISLIRLSKTGKQLGRDNTIPCQNMLTEYEYYHGTTVGILIRNGENLYLGWTEEERVHIKDDLILGSVVKEELPANENEDGYYQTEWQEEQRRKKEKETKKVILDGLVSRTFVYNILQGVVDHSNILPLPEGIKLNAQSEYVMYSMADKWIEDNRYGKFTDIIERCNKKVQQGDTILTVQHLIPERASFNGQYMYSRKWENVRGRGDRNRTHDCSVEDCTIYPVNLVEFDEPVEMVHYTDPNGNDCGWTTQKRAYIYHDDGTVGMEGLSEGCRVIGEFTKQRRHVFVSVKKEDVWYYGRETDKEARANFEVYNNEFINLTYMNSSWLQYVITSKSLGRWTIAGKSVNYAYAIHLLKTALDFVRKREETEKKNLDAIDASICADPEWPAKLSEWKIEKGVREITEYQAKRFYKSQKISK